MLFAFRFMCFFCLVFFLFRTFATFFTLSTRSLNSEHCTSELPVLVQMENRKKKIYVWTQCSRKWTQTEYCSKFSLCICVFAMWILRVLCPAVCPVYTITSSCMSEPVGGRATLLWPINIQDSTIRKKKLKQKVCINTRTTNTGTHERAHTRVKENLWINTFRKHLAIWSSKLRELCGVVFYVLQWIL